MDNNRFIMSFTVDKTFESDVFLKLRLRVCHDGESPNKTYFTRETMEAANASLEYIPLLAHVYVDEETGKPVIGSHDMHLEEDRLNEGDYRIIYDETPIGVIPSLADNNCSIEEYNGLNYTFVDCYLWRSYANYAEQLVEDAEAVKLSMEIDMPDSALSYDAANDRYNISSYRYRGITLLNENLGTGMKDALATTTNFSANDDIKSKMIILMEELQKCLREYSGDNAEEEEEAMDTDNNEIVVETEADATVEVEAEVVESDDNTIETTDETGADEPVNEPVVVEEPGEPETSVAEEFSEPELEPLVCTFRISHDDTRYGLQSLLNAMCDECHFYSVLAVYDKYFYYCDYFTGDAFKQSYKVRKDVVSLSGDPEPVFTEFVTQAERDALEKLRKDYAELKEFKDQYDAAELRAQKDAILSKKSYEKLVNVKEFVELKANSDNLTVDELQSRAKMIYADYMENHEDNDPVVVQPKAIGFNFNIKETKKKPYGNLFK